jgi:hypothetical protein
MRIKKGDRGLKSSLVLSCDFPSLPFAFKNGREGPGLGGLGDGAFMGAPQKI